MMTVKLCFGSEYKRGARMKLYENVKKCEMLVPGEMAKSASFLGKIFRFLPVFERNWYRRAFFSERRTFP